MSSGHGRASRASSSSSGVGQKPPPSMDLQLKRFFDKQEIDVVI
jgi:hypothetical protein